MAEGTVTRTEAPRGAADAQRGTRQSGWQRALTSPLGFFSGFMGTRYQSTVEVSAAAKTEEPEEPKKSLWGRFTGAASSLKDSVVGAFTSAKAAVEEKGVVGALGDFAGKAWDGVKAAGRWVVDGVVNTARTVIDAASKALHNVASFISKVWTSFTAHNREVERRIDEQKREQQRQEERRSLAKRDESKHLEDTVQRARSVARAQEFQAEQGLIDKVTATSPGSHIDNAALERKRERERAQKALS